MRAKSSHSRSRARKTVNPRKINLQGTRFIPLMLQREDSPCEIFYAPECKKCGRPIFDFGAANLSTVDETDAELIPIGKVGDAEASIIPSAGAFAFHKSCDASGNSPWVTLRCVIRNDQRREFERGWRF
jgi:hypothetical protein